MALSSVWTRTLLGTAFGASAGLGMSLKESRRKNVLRNSLIGAGIGAGLFRYGGTGLHTAVEAFGAGQRPLEVLEWGAAGVIGQGIKDFRGATRIANYGINAFPALGRRYGLWR